MPLHKLEEFNPNYRETFGGDDVKGLEIHSAGDVQIGSVLDALVDENGRFRYLVVDAHVDYVNKRILLPINLARISYPTHRVYIEGLSKEQLENLPEYKEDSIIDDSFEKTVRNIYGFSTPDVNGSESYINQPEPSLYALNEQYQQTVRLHEERLIANKHRVKTGEVSVGKHIEMETARVGVPIQKERVVIERIPASSTGMLVNPNEIKFQAGEVARIEVYEETPEIHKEAFVREEVRLKKVIDRDMVEAQDTIRREELNINTEGDINFNEPGVRTDLKMEG